MSKIDLNQPAAADEKNADAPVIAGTVAATAESDVIAGALGRVASPVVTAATEVEDEPVVMGLPPTLEFREDVPNTFSGNAFEVRLYGEGCLDCKHLVPSAEEAENDCHFSNGNSFCPAAFTRVVFVGHRMRYVSKINKYKASGNTNLLLKVLGDLEKEELDTKDFVLKEVGLLPK